MADAGAIYMGIGEAPAIAAALLARGKPRSLPIVVVENASLLDQRIVYTTLGQLPALVTQEFTGPTLLLVGPQFAARAAAADHAETAFDSRTAVRHA